ncbi:hypothetical protein NHN26_15880 [Rhodovulum tesquicola]|uniref:hypothetical protein n=1 Tax=Rhodovulum tesquicola TaxID=540254 RepID=UPI0020970259|nr:hypothetical protein [Rhodovulum tesquicola]MCO8146693.1 hypothetical protein [Rhodovulum tesquicola]
MTRICDLPTEAVLPIEGTDATIHVAAARPHLAAFERRNAPQEDQFVAVATDPLFQALLKDEKADQDGLVPDSSGS